MIMQEIGFSEFVIKFEESDSDSLRQLVKHQLKSLFYLVDAFQKTKEVAA